MAKDRETWGNLPALKEGYRMNTGSNPIEKYSLPAFLILTILLTVLVNLVPLPPDVVPMLMVLIPALVAMILTAMVNGGRGEIALLRRIFQLRISLKWYLITVGLALLVRLSMSVLALLLGWIPAIRLRSASPTDLVSLGALLFVAAALEELGWRAYALPRLMARRSALFSALFIGVFWGLLHLFLLLPGMMYAGEHPLGLLLELIGLSVVVTWLFVQTGGNIFITSLFHAAQSLFVVVNEGISLTQQLWLMAVVYVALALILTFLYGASLGRRPTRKAAVLGSGSEAA
jgi:uncharacterized protein